MASHCVLQEHKVEKLLFNTEIILLLRDRRHNERPYPARERLTALGTDKSSGNKVWVMVALEVHIKKLLLSEGLLTLAAGVWFLPCVSATVHHHVTFLDTKACDETLK